MVNILLARLQQFMNQNLPGIQAEFRKSRGTRDQIANICWIIEKARKFQKRTYFCFIDYAKAFDSVDHNKLWKILRDGNTRLPYLHPEKHLCRSKKQQNWTWNNRLVQNWKGSHQGCTLFPCLFNFYAEYVMWNGQAGWIKSWNQDYREKYQ